jgi:hypothetical protein
MPAGYQQPIKNTVREHIWSNTIRMLSTDRQTTCILRKDRMLENWNFVDRQIHLLGRRLDPSIIREFTDILDIEQRVVSEKELRVLYLAGSEPLNDFKCAIDHNVHPRNIWAIEGVFDVYSDGVSDLGTSGITSVNILPQKIEDFIDGAGGQFDIIYLDFTLPLLTNTSPKPLNALIATLAKQALRSPGCMVVTSAVPDRSSAHTETMRAFFEWQPLPCAEVITPGSEGRTDDLEAHGVSGADATALLHGNHESACSAFATDFPVALGLWVIPSQRVFSRSSLRKLVLEQPMDWQKSVALFDERLRKKGVRVGLDDFLELRMGSLGWLRRFLIHLEVSAAYPALSDRLCKKIGGDLSALECLSYLDHLTTPQETNTHISNRIKHSVAAMMNSGLEGGRLACDAMYPTDWLNFAVHQLGPAYFANGYHHDRFFYKAKERRMMVDIFAFDQCRALFDFTPLLTEFGKGMADPGMWCIARSGIDLISKAMSAYGGLGYGRHLRCWGEAKDPASEYCTLGARREWTMS